MISRTQIIVLFTGTADVQPDWIQYLIFLCAGIVSLLLVVTIVALYIQCKRQQGIGVF